MCLNQCLQPVIKHFSKNGPFRSNGEKVGFSKQISLEEKETQKTEKKTKT